MLGNEKPEALPVVELDLSKLPEGTPKIAGSRGEVGGGHRGLQEDLAVLPRRSRRGRWWRSSSDTAIQAYQALQLRDYGRIDFRLAKDGTLHVLEVNPNPYLLPTAEFSMAAKKSGRSYSDLIGEIVDLALARYGENGKPKG